eukprot:14510099-Ditylum_brightwellii.AAC.2
MCANGQKQRGTIPKEDTTSLMVALKSVIITSMNGAKENRDIATIDIPGHIPNRIGELCCHSTGRQAGQIIGQDIPKHLPKVPQSGKRYQVHPLCTTSKGTQWLSEKCPLVLQKSPIGPTRIWFCHQPIQPLCGK